MITPKFFLGQDSEFIYIHIYIKYAKLKEAEIEINENRFWFYLKPYHLSLTFPHEIQSDSREKMCYDIYKSEISISIAKKHPNEFFENLDLISNLMNPAKGPLEKSRLIEEIGSEVEILQDNSLNTGYGFNRKEKNLFVNRQEEKYEIFDVDPDNTTAEERVETSKNVENQDWNVDRYLEDLDFEANNTEFSVLYKDFLPDLVQRIEGLSLDNLIRLSKKSVIIHKDLEKTCIIQIMDIVLCFCLEMRTIGEITCESALTINKISPTLACLTEFSSPKEMVSKVFRRFLVYSLYRNVEIMKIALQDTLRLFKDGKTAVLRILLNIKIIFAQSEPRFLLNKLFIDDFIVWVQKFEEFLQFSTEIQSLALPEIETLELDFTIS